MYLFNYQNSQMETLVSKLKYIFLITLNVFVMILLVFYFFLSIKLSNNREMLLQRSRHALSNQYSVKGKNKKFPLPYLFVTSTFGLSHKENEIHMNREIINHFLSLMNHSVLIFTDPFYNRYIPSNLGIYKQLYDEYADIECIKRLFNAQNTYDPKHIHNKTSIYKIFSSSICFAKYATEIIKSNFYFWIDIRSLVKIKRIKIQFPNPKFVMSLPYIKRPLFFTLTEKKKHTLSLSQFLKSPFIQMTFWGGTKYSIQRISNSYWKEYVLFLKSKQLLESDQNLFNALVMYYLEDSILVSQNEKPGVKRCTNDSSLFFAYYISGSACSSTAITQNVKDFIRY